VIDRAPDTSHAILDAAELLFARRGFAATTIKMIASESGQNSALIYYYYDSKASLYRHVLERVVGSIAEGARRRISPGADPERVVRGVVESQVAVLAGRPHLPVLLARELIDWKAAHAEPAIRHLTATLFQDLTKAITAGQAAGIFRPDIDPKFAAISTIAQVGYLVLASPIAGILLDRGPDGPTAPDLHAFGAHAAEFALSALRPAAIPASHASIRLEETTT
jgi:TetR/AcrR family transcriptional regulator